MTEPNVESASTDSPPPIAVNKLQTPLLIFGDCGPSEFESYRAAFDAMYLKGAILDRFGRRIKFFDDSAEHVCYCKDQYDKRRPPPRERWRPDRAERIPWIEVALTHPTSVLKENKEKGRENYLIVMQILSESGLKSEYYHVVVQPRRNGTEADFKTAYRLDLQQWIAAKNFRSVRLGDGKRSGGGRY
jgi:hypothetical protein